MGLKILLITLTLLTTFLVILMHYKYKINKIILNVLGIFLLIFKIIEFSYYYLNDMNIFPVEFSHISYFIVSIIIIFNIKRLYFFGSFISFTSGITYVLTYLFKDNEFVTFNIYMTFISHIILLFIGLTLMFNMNKYKKIDTLYLFLGFILIITYSLLVHYKLIFPNQDLSYVVLNQIIFGSILKYIGITTFNEITYLIYYPSLILVLVLLITSIYFINKHLSLDLITRYKLDNKTYNKLIDRFILVKHN